MTKKLRITGAQVTYRGSDRGNGGVSSQGPILESPGGKANNMELISTSYPLRQLSPDHLPRHLLYVSTV